MTSEVKIKVLRKIDGSQPNIEYSGFKSIAIANSIFTLGKTFRIEYFENPRQDLKFNKGDFIQISIDNKPVLRGFIENFERSINFMQPSYTQIATGGDLFSQVQHSQLETSITQKETSVKSMISNVFNELGYDGYKINIEEDVNLQGVKKNGKGKKAQDKLDFITGEVGMNAFDYISKILAKTFFIINSNGLNTINISRAVNAKPYKTILKANRHDPQNNVINASLDTNSPLPYGNIVIVSRGDAKNTAGTTQLNNYKGGFINQNAIPFRKKVIVLDFPANSNRDCQDLAEWYGKNYIKINNAINIELPTFYFEDELIDINRLIRLECDYLLDKPEFFLISEVEHELSFDNTSPKLSTRLKLIDKQGVGLDDINDLAGIKFL
jgi:prophage tail gpP-like protein